MDWTGGLDYWTDRFSLEKHSKEIQSVIVMETEARVLVM